MGSKQEMKGLMSATGMSREEVVCEIAYGFAVKEGQKVGFEGESHDSAVDYLFETYYNMASDYDGANPEREPIFIFMTDLVIESIRKLKASHKNLSWLKKKVGGNRLNDRAMFVLAGVTDKIQAEVNYIRGL